MEEETENIILNLLKNPLEKIKTEEVLWAMTEISKWLSRSWVLMLSFLALQIISPITAFWIGGHYLLFDMPPFNLVVITIIASYVVYKISVRMFYKQKWKIEMYEKAFFMCQREYVSRK